MMKQKLHKHNRLLIAVYTNKHHAVIRNNYKITFHNFTYLTFFVKFG